MAFFKCGGSKTATIIDGVESGKDLNLKSLGLRDLGIITPRIPKSVLGDLTYSYYSTYDSYINIVPFQGKLYFIYKYSSFLIFQYEVDTNTWIKIGDITADFKVGNIYWAKEINGIIYLFLGIKDVIGEEYRHAICYLEFTSDGVNLVYGLAVPSGTYGGYYRIYADDSDIYFFEAYSSYLYKFSTTTKTWTKLVSFDSKFISDITFIKKINDELHIYVDYFTNSTTLWKFICKITDKTLTNTTITIPYKNSNGFQFLYINNVLHAIFRALDSNSRYVPVLFKFEDDIFTQIDNMGDINGLYSASTFNFNNEIWYRNSQITSNNGETLRLGKFSEVYELIK